MKKDGFIGDVPIFICKEVYRRNIGLFSLPPHIAATKVAGKKISFNFHFASLTSADLYCMILWQTILELSDPATDPQLLLKIIDAWRIARTLENV